MKPLRAAVIGIGHLGRHHCRKFARCPGATLTTVVDQDPQRAQEVAAETGTQALTDYRELLGRIDIASIAVPTSLRFAVARDLLEAGIHVLVEKPITATVSEGRQLVHLAEKRELVLQVGHLERFNPVVQALAERVERPLFIECDRIAPFTLRGTDVDVIRDLMIHDIDIIMNLVGKPLSHIEASGAPVLTSGFDIANARLRFMGGCVANVTASRVSYKRERRLRIFQPNAYLSADLADPHLQVYRKVSDADDQGLPSVTGEQITLPSVDALEAEINSFVASVQQGTRPLVSGGDGLQALQIADSIIHQLESQPLSLNS